MAIIMSHCSIGLIVFVSLGIKEYDIWLLVLGLKDIVFEDVLWLCSSRPLFLLMPLARLPACYVRRHAFEATRGRRGQMGKIGNRA